MIFDMVSIKKLNPIVTELIIRGRKSNVSLVFIIQSYFSVPKILDWTSCTSFLRKLQTKENFTELQLKIN